MVLHSGDILTDDSMGFYFPWDIKFDLCIEFLSLDPTPQQ